MTSVPQGDGLWRPRTPTAATLLGSCPPKPLALPRTSAAVAGALRELATAGRLDLALPGCGDTTSRWSALAAFGRGDLALARLAEGHTDAVAILAEAGRPADPGPVYGVWAARSGGTGAALSRDGGRLRLTGTVRFCSGAGTLDRALVAATAPDGGPDGWLVDVDLADPRVHRDQDTWQAIGMDASDSPDVRFDELPVSSDMVVGEPGWYVDRRGFVLGSGGVAAVWLGGAAGVLDDVRAMLADAPHVDDHQLAHLGALCTALRAADALLTDTARLVDDAAFVQPAIAVRTAKSAVERAAWDIHDRVPRITGPTPLCRDRAFAQRLADLEVYVRQHHAERDLAALGRAVLDTAVLATGEAAR
ncbi:MAG TPA: acyl-CoA dehydrogenase family protein [Pseudonocardiaceae bacterium]|nr:acyl-CoA dehydrogenase family protein [Pseudonocardiaceae bacterium]